MVVLGQLCTKNFIIHWTSPHYVHVSTLKKYVVEIQVVVRVHHMDIVSWHRGFFGWMKLIGNETYNLIRWLIGNCTPRSVFVGSKNNETCISWLEVDYLQVHLVTWRIYIIGYGLLVKKQWTEGQGMGF
jgi:hypothetical protein